MCMNRNRSLNSRMREASQRLTNFTEREAILEDQVQTLTDLFNDEKETRKKIEEELQSHKKILVGETEQIRRKEKILSSKS
jgi:hypothetical protein